MRRTLTSIALATALLCGCKSEQAAPGAVKFVVAFQGFRPECVRVNAWDADAPGKRSSQPVRPASVAGPLQTQDKRGELSVAVFRGADWGRNLRLSAEGFEKGACDAQGNPLAGRQPVVLVESGTVVTQDGKVSDAVELVLSALDADGDGYVAAAGATPGTDCNDARAEAHPGATEVCNGLDDNCDAAHLADDGLPTTPWYLDEDGDGYGTTASKVDACQAPAKHVAQDGDCLDTGATAFISHPGASEACDGLDNNCDADHKADEGFDVDTACAEGNICTGKKACTADGKTTFCKGETFKKTFYADVDGDTKHGGAGVSECAAPAGYAELKDDCDDGDPFTYDGAQELCDGRDNDCSPATSDSSVCPSGGGSFANILPGTPNGFNWRSVVPWGNGGVWMVGESGNWARRAAGETNFTTGSCGGSTIWYSLWIDPRQGGSVYYAGTNQRLAVLAQDGMTCTVNPPSVNASAFTSRGIMGFTPVAGSVTIHGVGNTTGTVGKTFTWDGSTAASVSLSATDYVPLKDVHGVGPGTLFAVGDVQSGKSPISKFNPGTSEWEAQQVPAGTKNLLGVYVVNSKLAYAVGETGTVLKWNGATSWDTVPADGNGPGTGTLRSVLAFGESSVYVASQSGFVFRYNGTAWEKLATMTADDASALALYDIAGTRPDDIWVVGEDNKAYHWPQ
jgi:hypothetical protein